MVYADKMKTKVVGFLDKPSANSYGMVPLVIEPPDIEDKLIVYDVRSPPVRRIQRSEFHALVFSGHTLLVNLEIDVVLQEGVCALWTGHQFLSKTSGLNFPMPPHQFKTSVGSFSVVSTKEAARALEDFVKVAFARFRVESNPDTCKKIAQLMGWTLPVHRFTLAAAWKNSLDPSGELQFQIRNFPREFPECTTVEDLERHHRKLLET